MTNMKWRHFDGTPINSKIHDAVEASILKEKSQGHKLKVCIGTDSQVYSDVVEFATVIVFLREGKGGFMFISNDKKQNNMTIKERLLLEVAKSIEIAYSICDLLDKHGVDLEVHADINTNPQFKSNPALSEAMGYILGMGFIFKSETGCFCQY